MPVEFSKASISKSVNRSFPRPAGRLTRKAKYRRRHPQAEFLYCRPPFRYAPERPTTGKVRVARYSPTKADSGSLMRLRKSSISESAI
jgi:hypothetical protein